MPSIASLPRPARVAPTAWKRSREVSACPWVPVSLRPWPACSRTRYPVLGARPRTASRSGENGGRPLLCAEHRLTTSATTTLTREHDLERPILARPGFVFRVLPPLPVRWPPLPVRPSRGARRATALPLPREDRQRATPHLRRRLPDGSKPPRGGTPENTAPRDTACEAAPRAHRRSRRGWSRQCRCACVGRFARSEGTRPLSTANRARESFRGSPPPWRVEHPLVVGRRVPGRVGDPSACRPTEIPVSTSPAKGSVVAAIRMLSTSRELGACPACAGPRGSP